MLALGRSAHSCRSQSSSKASVIDGTPTRGIKAAPLINCRMSESLNSTFSKQKVSMIYFLVF